MLDVSITELLLTAVVAFLVMDPKEIPRVLREVMGFFRMLRETGEDLRRSVTMLAEEDISDLRKELDLREDIKQIPHAKPSTPRYIVDEAGNFQEVYDVSELMELDQRQKQEKRLH